MSDINKDTNIESTTVTDSNVENTTTQNLSDAAQTAKTNIIICYALFLASFLTGITFLIGGVWAYLKRDEARDTPFADHYQNIIRTFWTCIILSIVGVISMVFIVGWFLLLFGTIYLLWKSIKGISRITSNKAYN